MERVALFNQRHFPNGQCRVFFIKLRDSFPKRLVLLTKLATLLVQRRPLIGQRTSFPCQLASFAQQLFVLPPQPFSLGFEFILLIGKVDRLRFAIATFVGPVAGFAHRPQPSRSQAGQRRSATANCISSSLLAARSRTSVLFVRQPIKFTLQLRLLLRQLPALLIGRSLFVRKLATSLAARLLPAADALQREHFSRPPAD